MSTISTPAAKPTLGHQLAALFTDPNNNVDTPRVLGVLVMLAAGIGAVLGRANAMAIGGLGLGLVVGGTVADGVVKPADATPAHPGDLVTDPTGHLDLPQIAGWAACLFALVSWLVADNPDVVLILGSGEAAALGGKVGGGLAPRA